MGDTGDDGPGPDPELTVGTRVLVRRKSEADVTGEIVEDYAALTESGGTGHEWAPAHRWAIALDDGRLVFADTDEVTVDPSPHRDGTHRRREH
ncbi:hypothetical protein CJ179_03680 [Rhodococcus sp. ACS1]|uniref:DUF1918 domain-containing protein n=1 Tax=Rhodococcus koreensis TaxID=99653 RepID=A0A1H4N8L6_9NOCA|nr:MULTISPECIES: hypothetical protein [Rhodococcus]PBC52477.1 hypothetical protein CJ179_03680 [Rhodococcus sp. ACS1]QSE85462.1 hypothetical protein JWS14_36250 [Rhodococcus koreensis]SEB91800.1 hypothetical protein SAMN04490239_2178 [Rhodococcus koreensis]